MDHKESKQNLTIKEKAALCSGADGWHTEAIPHAGIPAVCMADGPNGIRKERITEEGKHITERATCYPCSCLMAASFDRNLLYQLGQTLSEEAKKKDVDLLLAPGVNIKRSPLCGRNFEYLSEDPLLSGKMGAALVRGLQESGTGATLKHFALNNQEKARLSVDSIADERAKREIYYKPFEIVVKEAGPWAVMGAYNKIDGVYATENESLLGILREEWGYDGVLMSDWGAVNDRVRGLKAGLDLEMPGSNGFHDRFIEEAIEAGELSEEKLDESVSRLVKLAEKVQNVHKNGVITDKQGTAAQKIISTGHEAARYFAEESIVLLKNEGGILPFSEKEKIAVVGEFAKTPRYQGGGAANVHPDKLTNFMEVVGEYTREYTFYPMEDKNQEGDSYQSQEISENDRILIFAGLPNAYESEGYDRPHMRLPEEQNRRIQELAEVHSHVVVVLFGGSAIEMPWLDKVKAVVMAYLPGQAGADALARILFGKANPSGKLPETFPVRWEDHPAYSNFGGEYQVVYQESILTGYRYFGEDKPVTFPFGHGLSYTEYAYTDLEVTVEKEYLLISCKVKNLGQMAGKEVIQFYAKAPEEDVMQPAKKLIAFEKLELKPEECKEVKIRLSKEELAYYDNGIHGWRICQGMYKIEAGASSRDIRLQKEIELEDTYPEIPYPFLPASKDRNLTPDDFEAILGHPLEEYHTRPFHRNSTLKEIRVTAIGKLLNWLVRKAAFSGNNTPQQEGQDIRIMLEAQADYLPIRAIVSHTGGAFSYKLLDTLIRWMNGRNTGNQAQKK